jgi:hydroxyacylglutathione hydrolase
LGAPEYVQKRIQFQKVRKIVVTVIVPIPCLADNYAYLVPNGSGGALVVDPGEAEPVHEALAERGLRLEAILCTHHHRDHVGGNAALAQAGVEVVAHASERARIPGFTRGVEDEEVLEVAGLQIRVLHVPGHTRGAVSYWIDGALFSGDTLFCAGCGRLREGTAAQLHGSLCRLVQSIPSDLTVYTGHEYAEKNLRFAAAVEPENQAISRRRALVAERRRQGLFCASTTLGEELLTNPFLRSDVPEVQAAVDLDRADPVLVFQALRQWKDAF